MSSDAANDGRRSTASSNGTHVEVPREQGVASDMKQESRPFWSKDVKDTRKGVVIQYLKGVAMITAILWIALPIFWGSNWLLLRYFNQMTVAVVDFETPVIGSANAAVGPMVIQMAEETNVSPVKPHLGFNIVDASAFPDGVEQVKENVGYSHHWGGIVVYPNCTSTWRTALQTGNSSYDPTGCVGLFYSGARFYQITILYLRPFMQQWISEIVQKASTQAIQTYVQENTGNTTALNLAATVPQAMAQPFSFFVEDVRPINHWAVSAPFEAALIYYLIFAFQLAYWGAFGRMGSQWSVKTTYHSLVTWRLATPMICYVWISLMFSLQFKAFQIPTDPDFGTVGGFFALWALNYLGLCAVGLALETMVSVLTPQFVPFFLMLWIILNITSSFQPVVVMEKFYHLMRAMPFYHMVEGYKIITHRTREPHKIGLNFGVLIAITAINIAVMCVVTALEVKRGDKQMRDKLEQNQQKNEKKQ